MLETKDSSQTFNWKQLKAEALRFLLLMNEALRMSGAKKLQYCHFTTSSGRAGLAHAAGWVVGPPPGRKKYKGVRAFHSLWPLIFGLPSPSTIKYQWPREDQVPEYEVDEKLHKTQQLLGKQQVFWGLNSIQSYRGGGSPLVADSWCTAGKERGEKPALVEKTVERPGETKAKEGAVLSYVFDSIGRQRRSLAFL